MSLNGYKPKYGKALWKQIADEHDIAVPGQMKGRKAVRRVSKKQQARNAAYIKLARQTVEAMVKAGHKCPVVNEIYELQNAVRYGHPVSDRLNEIHHMRGRLGSLLMDTRHWLAVSKEGHRFIHQFPEIARKHGWLCEKGKWNTVDLTPKPSHE